MTTVETTHDNGNKTEDQENQETAISVQHPNAARPGLQLKLSTEHQLPGNRPVEANHLQIFKTFSSMGAERPITKSTLNTTGEIILSGSRPISAKTLQISETYSVMGNRPVASNQIDNPTTLMGYID